MNLFSARPRWRWLIFISLVLIAIGAALIVTHHPPPLPAPVILLPLPYKIPPQKVPIPDRWIPRSWGWMWTLKERVLVRAKVIQIEVVGFHLPPPLDSILSTLSLGQTASEPHAFTVWVI